MVSAANDADAGASPRCCRAARLAAFPRLARLSDAEFREVQFAVLLRRLPKALLAYKFLAQADGQREAGLLAVEPVVRQPFDEATLRQRPLSASIWLVPLLLLCLSVSMLLWMLLMDRSPPQPVSSTDSFVISYPRPLTGSFEVMDDDAIHSAAAVHPWCLTMLVSAVLASAMLTSFAMTHLGLFAWVSLARWRWVRMPRSAYERLLAAPVHTVTLYPAEAGLPSGELDLDSDLREQQAEEAFDDLRSAADRVRDVPRRRCWGGFEQCNRRMIFWSIVGTTLILGIGFVAGNLVAVYAPAGTHRVWAPQADTFFKCPPLRPFVVSEYAPMMQPTETVQFDLRPCSPVTLWADLEVRVDNVTSVLQWPCVAPLPTAECWIWRVMNLITAAAFVMCAAVCALLLTLAVGAR